jgi:hypothetical protein
VHHTAVVTDAWFAHLVVEADVEMTMLQHFLNAQRNAVLLIVDGLDYAAFRSAPLPSGWTVLGLIEHLGHAERHWFQEVAIATVDEPPWPPGYDATLDERFASTRTVDEVIAFYRTACARSNEVLSTVGLDAVPLGKHDRETDDDIDSMRWIVLHMIEETARHAGHLDAARELLDGTVGLAPR